MEIKEKISEDILEFTHAFRDIYKLSNIPKLRSFQYRLLQRGIVTNIHLYKWNISETESCTFCREERETYSHLFFECQMVRQLWEKVADYIRNTYPGKDVPELCIKKILLNKIVSQTKHVANFICLLTKQYIYKQRCFKQDLSFNHLQSIIGSTRNMEKYIAIKNQKLGIHQKKWGQQSLYRLKILLQNMLMEYRALMKHL